MTNFIRRRAPLAVCLVFSALGALPACKDSPSSSGGSTTGLAPSQSVVPSSAPSTPMNAVAIPAASIEA
ncbi:MAG: hypothetical protein ABI551_27635, partial [Polyangiaceae bacterium]